MILTQVAFLELYESKDYRCKRSLKLIDDKENETKIGDMNQFDKDDIGVQNSRRYNDEIVLTPAETCISCLHNYYKI